MATYNVDGLIYGQTEAGIMAACEAADRGLNVLLLGGTDAFGFMGTNGLLGFDGNAGMTGIIKAFFQGVGALHGLTQTTCAAPRTNEAVFRNMLAARNVPVVIGNISSIVINADGNPTRVNTTNGHIINIDPACGCIDASSCGDLLLAGGATIVRGSEAQSDREPLAGFGIISDGYTRNPYKSDGVTLKNGILAYPEGKKIGQADDSIQGWNFRTPVMLIADGGIPITQPPNYDRENYVWFNDILPPTSFSPPVSRTYAQVGDPSGNANPPLPSYNDTNFFDIPGIDKIGYLTGTPAQRTAIYTYARNWWLGYWYFMSTDSAVYGPRQAWFAARGLCPLEFPDNGNFPRQIYAREANRIVADYVMHQDDTQQNWQKDYRIAFGRLSLDKHVRNMYANAPGVDANGVIYEGRMGDINHEADITDMYHIPLGILVPTTGSLGIISGGYVSGWTSVAFGSGRATVTMMECGRAAGIALWLRKTTGKAFSDLGPEVAAEVAAIV